MTLTPGTRLGPYEILAPLGAGGMGEVYQASDTRLGREVAVKISAERFSERFEKEARAIASLNHPNICTLHDVGPNYLVMELVDGPTLAERIKDGPLPLREALIIARQIADALEAAHEKGIVHRDLKPGNIKVKSDGTVKVLDFGLAKLTGRPNSDSEASPTISMTAAHSGVILGTAGYMSPEQARGKPVDYRSDIWAFGVVLYEALCGVSCFRGETISDTLASLIKEDPDWSKLPSATPAHIQKLLHRCLNKNPKQRLQAIGDLRIFLEDFPESPAPPRRLGRRAMFAWAILAVLLAGAAAVSTWFLREPHSTEQVSKFVLLPPEKTSFNNLAVSPDGQSIAFTARDESGRIQLWVRRLDSLTAHALTGTDNAAFPFWSPDARFIAFAADGKLKKIEAGGGIAQTICDTPSQRGGSWSPNGTIIFAPGSDGPLFQVNAMGGKAEPLTHLDESKEETSHRWPFILPDGTHYLYAVRSGQPAAAGIYVGDLRSSARTRLLPDVSNMAYVPDRRGPGRLLFARGSALMTQRFHADKLNLAGEAVALMEDVGFSKGFSQSAYSASETGVLAYTSVLPGQDTQLSWFDRAGRVLGMLGGASACNDPALSPDDRQLSYDCVDPQSGKREIWVADLIRGVVSRLGPGERAVWSPDSKKLAFAGAASLGLLDRSEIAERDSNGVGPIDLLLKGAGAPTAWSRDKRFLLFRKPQALWMLPFAEGRPGQPFLYRSFTSANNLLQNAVFAPNSKWVAYESSDSGTTEIYLDSFGGSNGQARSTERWQISNGGGRLPRWRGDGSELFYLSPRDSKVMAVEVKNKGTTIEPGVPRPLFSANLSNVLSPGFDVTGDAQRFLVQVTSAPVEANSATVVLNWPAAVKP